MPTSIKKEGAYSRKESRPLPRPQPSERQYWRKYSIMRRTFFQDGLSKIRKGCVRMTDETRDILYQFITTRRAIAFKRLNDNPQYQELCRKVAESKKRVDELFERFSVEEHLFIHDHYDGERAKFSDFSDEAYIQGLRDSFKIYTFLGIFGCEETL